MKKFMICLTVLGMACLPMITFGQGPQHKPVNRPQQKPAVQKQQFQPQIQPSRPQPVKPQLAPQLHQKQPVKAPWGKTPVVQNHHKPVHMMPAPHPMPVPVPAPAPAVIVHETCCQHDTGSGLSLTIGGRNSLFQFSLGL